MKKLIALAVAATLMAGCSIHYSDGVRVGVVQKISTKGFVWKTSEGELVTDGFKIRSRESGTTGSNVWNFCTKDAGVVADLERAAESGHPVKLTYTQVILRAPWDCDSSYVVTKVTPAN